MNRKTLVTSVNSNQSVQSLASGQGNDSVQLLDSSVDDLFAKYLVHQLQKLQNGYKNDVIKAKDDLHQLVGGKYRELIRIAEVIDLMNANSGNINSTLSDLSYKPANYVPFGGSAYAKFDSKSRSIRAESSRKDSQKTIVNNVINNKLIGFDLKLQSGFFQSSAMLLHFARIYHSIVTLFGRTLQHEVHAAKHFNLLRQNFIAYLEQKLCTVIATGDSFHVADHLQSVEDLLSAQDPTADDESLDMLDINDMEDEDLESLTSNKILKASTSPIVNYILAYVVVNNEDPELDNLASITQRFLSMRLAHLSELTQQCSRTEAAQTLSFFKVNSYIETTMTCIADLLLNPESELITHLKANNKWDASELIGFHGWFDPVEVRLNSSTTSIGNENLPKKFSSDISRLLEARVDNILQTIEKLQTCDLLVESCLHLLRNALIAFQKMHSLAESEDRSSYVLLQVYTTEFVQTLTTSIFKKIEESSLKHVRLLSSGEMSIAKDLITHIEEGGLFEKQQGELFSLDVVNLIDTDLDSYLSALHIVDENKHGMKGSDDLLNWQDKLIRILKIISLSEDTTMSRLSEISQKAPINSSFNGSSKLSSRADALNQQVRQSIQSQLQDLLSRLTTLPQTTHDDPEKIIRALDLTNQLYFSVDLVQHDQEALKSAFDEISCELLDRLFDLCMSQQLSADAISFEQAFVNSFSSVDSHENTREFQAPSVRFQSLLYGFAQKLLSSKVMNSFSLQKLLTESNLKDSFRNRKNTQLENLITKGFGAIPAMSAGLLEPSAGVTNHDDSTKTKAQTGSKKKNKKKSKGNKKLQQSTEEGDVEGPNTMNGEDENQQDDSEKDDAKKAGDTDPAVEKEAEGNVHDDSNDVRDGQNLSVLLRQALYHASYLLNFTTQEGVAVEDERLRSWVEKANNALKGTINENDVESLVKSANDYYKAHKEIYTPLLS